MVLSPGGGPLYLGQLRVTRPASCWKIVRRDGTSLYFTGHDRNLTLADGNTYQSTNSLGASAKRRNSELEESSVRLLGIIDSAAIDNADINAGLYRNATLTEYVVDWKYPTLAPRTTTVWYIRSIKYTRESWDAQVEGAASKLRAVVGDTYTRLCSLDLYGPICRVTAATFTVTAIDVAAVVAGSERTSFDAIDAHIPTQSDDYYNDARITWQTGNNAGLVSLVKSYVDTGRVFELWEPTVYNIVAGDTFDLRRACNKDRLGDCKTVFNNVVNNRSEDLAPGTIKTLRTN